MQPDKLLRYHLRQIPLVRLYLFFLIGIFLRNILNNIYLVLLLLGVFLILQLVSRKIEDSTYYLRNSIKGLSFSLLFMVIGFIYPQTNFRAREITQTQKQWKGVILDDAKVRKNTTTFIANVQAKNSNAGKSHKIKLTLENPDVIPLPGDSIYFTSTLQRICNRNNPAEFDYAGYMQRKGIIFQTYVSQKDYEIKQVERISNIKFIALRWRTKLVKQLHNYDFNEENQAVLAALTLGYKYLLPEEVSSKFAHTGAMHILAVSCF